MRRWRPTKRSAGIFAAVSLLTLLSYLNFPGHTWLQSDTQIYVPILEHLRDPAVFEKDLLVKYPHVSFTLYDEIALGLRKVTGLGLREVLSGEQLVFRGLGILGVYLIATALGLAPAPALLVAAVFSLGATIPGPAVLALEYEPVPRGFAVPLLFLATGLAAHGRCLGAGTAGAAAFLIHAPTAYPFWAVYFCVALWPARPQLMQRRLYGLLPLLCATVILLIASRHQAGAHGTQVFFSRLDPLQEQLQRMRTNYVWVSTWAREWLPHYLALYALAMAAYLRVRSVAPFDLRALLIGLPLIGILSVPISWFLLERMKWAFIPQIQPARAVLFVTAFAVLLAAVAGCEAIKARRILEALAWFALAYWVPVNTKLLALPEWRRLATVAVLAVVARRALSIYSRPGRWRAAGIVVAALAPFFVIPNFAGVRNYAVVNTAELTELTNWARSSTPADSVFLFPDAGESLYPGVFRAEALRAVYVDWKAGGQVNFFKEFAAEWWSRWQKTMTGPVELSLYRGLGIDYVVVRAEHRRPGEQSVFENPRFVVYPLVQPPRTVMVTPSLSPLRSAG